MNKTLKLKIFPKEWWLIRYNIFKKSLDLKTFNLHEKETFLRISVDKESYSEDLIAYSRHTMLNLRQDIERYIKTHHNFKISFKPLTIASSAPEIVKSMGIAAQAANVGPMAAVAGAIAEELGAYMDRHCREIIIENGGDIYIKSGHERTIAIYAGKTKFSYKIGLQVAAGETPFSLCTSSGTTGSSISLGRADAVVIKAHSAALADAVATATANRIQTPADLNPAIEFARAIPGVTGALAIKEQYLGVWGDMNLVGI